MVALASLLLSTLDSEMPTMADSSTGRGNEYGSNGWRKRRVASGRFWPILLKKSRRDFFSRKSVVDVEIWFVQKAELSWFLRSNAKIE